MDYIIVVHHVVIYMIWIALLVSATFYLCTNEMPPQGHTSCTVYVYTYISRLLGYIYTPSVLVKEVVLDKIWIKHWEYKSSITFKLLSLQMWKLYDNMNRFVLKNTFIKVYVYHFSINIFLKIRGQSCVLETVSLS